MTEPKDVVIGVVTLDSGVRLMGYQPTGASPYWTVTYKGQDLGRFATQKEAMQEAEKHGKLPRTEGDEVITLSEREPEKGT